LEAGAVRDAFRTFGDLLDVTRLRIGKTEPRPIVPDGADLSRLEGYLKQLLAAPNLRHVAYVEAVRQVRRAESLGIKSPAVAQLAARLLPSPYAVS
ncbi:MAG: hypothetical protein AAFY88_14285, partial [Acidobacteriota bacterium]